MPQTVMALLKNGRMAIANRSRLLFGPFGFGSRLFSCVVRRRNTWRFVRGSRLPLLELRKVAKGWTVTYPKSPSLQWRASKVLELGHCWLNASVSEDSNVISVELGDGAGEAGLPKGLSGHFAFCKTRSPDQGNIGLLPDPYAIDFALKLRSLRLLTKDEAWRRWQQKSDCVFWRGSLTGPTELLAQSSGSYSVSNARLDFVLASRNYLPRIDARIVALPQSNAEEKELILGLLKLAPTVSEAHFLRYTSYIDLDGNSSAWGTIKKLYGLTFVIKPTSPFHLLYHQYLTHRQNIWLVEKPEPQDVMEALEQTSSDERFEIAYRGHEAAFNYLASLRDGRWFANRG